MLGTCSPPRVPEVGAFGCCEEPPAPSLVQSLLQGKALELEEALHNVSRLQGGARAGKGVRGCGCGQQPLGHPGPVL